MAESPIEPGGFLPPSLPSPVPSHASNITSSQLPHPRSQPLRAGSAKEEAARRYVESRLMHISRRYTKKHQPPDPDEEVHGYHSMSEVAKDLSEVVDVLWLSGTREFAFRSPRYVTNHLGSSQSTDSIFTEHCTVCDHISFSLPTFT